MRKPPGRAFANFLRHVEPMFMGAADGKRRKANKKKRRPTPSHNPPQMMTHHAPLAGSIHPHVEKPLPAVRRYADFAAFQTGGARGALGIAAALD